jgi:hypothetical protein
MGQVISRKMLVNLCHTFWQGTPEDIIPLMWHESESLQKFHYNIPEGMVIF